MESVNVTDKIKKEKFAHIPDVEVKRSKRIVADFKNYMYYLYQIREMMRMLNQSEYLTIKKTLRELERSILSDIGQITIPELCDDIDRVGELQK